ncbi:MAG: hypothetical protein J1F64_09065, partial [Oscillospiraceae bacterium]|nr:hypothetical protein [Oscillospiraceae bacterium]
SVQNGKLTVSLGSKAEAVPDGNAVFIVASYDGDTMTDVRTFRINGDKVDLGDYTVPEGDNIKLFIWDGVGSVIPLARSYEVK